MNDNNNGSWYDRPPRPLNGDRSQGRGGRESGRLSRSGEESRQAPSRPPPALPFQQVDDNPQPTRSGGLFKSPFPSQPGAPIRQRVQERLPYEDEGVQAVEPELLVPPARQRTDRADHDARGAGRPLSRPPAAYTGEEADGFALPRRRKRPRVDDPEAPRRRRRTHEAGAERMPLPGKPGVPARKEVGPYWWKIARKVVLAVFLLSACSSTSFAVARFYHVYTIAQSVTGQQLPNVGTANENIQPPALSDTLSGVNAFNMLLLGSDNDAKFDSGVVLTQTDIVVRVDLKNHKVTMVSIPRDMWVPSDLGACCYKLDEISAAITYGPSTPMLNGFAHTVATIENDFHIPISAFAWVGLQGFVDVIDTLGGVDVDVLHPIVDDAYPKDLDPHGDPYAYQRLYLAAGPQHLNGEQALNYVRSRHSDLRGDFGRSERQQSVLVALKKKLDSGAILSHLDELANDLKDRVITSLTIPQVLALANFARTLKPTDFAQKVLSAPTYGHSENVNGKDVIQPHWGAINATIAEIFTDSAPPQVNLRSITAKDTQTVATEGARILIQNGSNTSGVAAQLAALLKSQGFKVVRAENADRAYLATQVVYFKPQFDGTCQVLSKMLGVIYQASTQKAPEGVDIVIIIGNDTAAQIQQQA